MEGTFQEGTFMGTFSPIMGMDFREQLTGYEISAPQGVQIEKNGNQSIRRFSGARFHRHSTEKAS